MSVSFFVPGNPVPQARPRAFKMGEHIRMYDPKTSVDWKKVVSQVAALTRNRYCGSGPLRMTLKFYLKWPASKKKPLLMPWHTKKPDADNLAKAVKDALSGICYKDDSQICILIVEKVYASVTDTGVRVFIEEL